MNVCDFGTILKQLRKNHGLTQGELGSKLGLSKAVISKYENGMSYPTFDVLVRITDYFKVTTDYLLGVERSKTLDVSALSETQIDAVRKVITEFNKLNNR